MASTFPTSLDTFTNPTATSLLTSPSHAQQHADINDAVEALEAKVAIGNTVLGVYQSWTPTYTNFTLGNGTVTANYCRVNNFVHAYAQIVLGSTSTVTGPVSVSVPVNINAGMISGGGDVTAFPLGAASYNDESVVANFGWAMSSSATTVRLMVDLANATYSQRISMNTTVPFTWATGDSFRFSAYYQAA
tara:strand:+ start:2074 stop:2643 length:570 start_codon:yes stop_codon:yes gene_type:complete